MRRHIDLPSELLPSETDMELAKKIDESYLPLYEMLLKEVKGMTPSDAIATIAGVKREQIALGIGSKLSNYDKDVLQGVIERYISEMVFYE